MGELDFSFLIHAWPALWQGFRVTLQITVTAVVVGLLLGIFIALARISRWRFLALAGTVYVNLFRSIPLVMVILWFYLLVPQWLQGLVGGRLEDTRFTSALVAFSLFEAAFYAEIIRAGIQSVPVGQRQAALALGLSPGQTMFYIILPQALRNMVPLLLTQAIILFQDTSLVYVIGLADLFGTATRVGDRDGR
ncbi:MAG: ABC transporter permease subunit, partial [Magnetococcales bacterium]|nr:ABC transporter permease subunit [Magnetococcales bacterium]